MGTHKHASDAHSRTKSLESQHKFRQKYRNKPKKETLHLIPDVADEWRLDVSAKPALCKTLQLFLQVLELRHFRCPPNIAAWNKHVQKKMQSEKLNLFAYSLYSLKRQQVASFCTRSGTLFFSGITCRQAHPDGCLAKLQPGRRRNTHTEVRGDGIFVFSVLNNTTLDYAYPKERKSYNPFIEQTSLQRYTKPSAYLTMTRLFNYKII